MPRGTLATRTLIARVCSHIAMRRGEHNEHFHVRYASKRWGERSGVAMIMKSGLAAGTSGDSDWGSKLADSRQATVEFIEAARPMTILGRLEGLRRVPANTPVAAVSTGSVAYWRGQSKAIRVSRLALQRSRLVPLSVNGMVVQSDELWQDESPEAEALIRNDLLRASVEAEDAAFIDPANAGTANVTPASITYGAPGFTSIGILEDDLASALEMFTGDLATSSWVMHPRLAAQIALKARGKGAGAALGARGGELLGLPALVSAGVPYDSSGGAIALVDAAGIAATEDGGELSVSNQGTVELDTAPTGAGDTPTAASATVVSLWQGEMTAAKVSRRVNWSVARPGAVVTVTGCNYEGT